MASNYTSDPQALDPAIQNLQTQIQGYQNRIDSSVSGSSSVLTPSSSDIADEVAKNKAQTALTGLQKTQLSSEWYGDPNANQGSSEQGGASTGAIGKVLNTLSLPLRGIVAGTKSLIGDAPNPKMQEDFSDLLKEHNVPYPISAPLGFALDVALDPVNWLTAGTGALVPRVAVGLAKGAAEGGLEGGVRAAAKGLESSVLQKAAGTLDLAGRIHGVPIARFGQEGYTGSFMEGLSNKANEAWDAYKGLTGVDPLAKVGQAGADIPFVGQRYNLADLAKGVMSYMPGGDGLYDALHYSSRDWLDQQKLLDSVERASAKSIEEARPVGEEGAQASEQAGVDAAGKPVRGPEQLSNPLIRPNMELLQGVPSGGERDALIDEFNKVADDASFVNQNPTAGASANPEQNAWRIIQEAQNTDQLRETMMQLHQMNQAADGTGIKWFDNASNWAKNVKVKIGDNEVRPLKEFLDGYNALIQGVFKPAHTVLSPVTWAMNVMSAPIMYMMMGGEDVGKMMGYYRDSYKSLMGIDPRAFVLNSGFLDSKWLDTMIQNPGTIRKSFGVGPGYFLGKGYVDQMVQMGKDQGLWSAGNEDEALRAIQNFSDEIKAQMQNGELAPKQGSFLGKIFSKTRQPDAGSPSDMMSALREQIGRGGVPVDADLPAGQTVRDFAVDNPILDKVENWIKEKAAAGSAPAKVYSSFMDKARAGYEHQDQSMRMAIAMALTRDGLSENGIKIISRFSPFKQETDLTEKYVKNGKTYWRISPMKALDIANDAAINYGAMPAAIRMLRSMPILGAPFASFAYGMGLRTAQTLAYNPSLFNKVNYALKAAGGNKTPLEREALNPPPGQPNYYGWYNDPAMFRMPVNFFDNYPLYLNLTNALPYYSLNIFQPANRTYADVLPNSIVQTLDHSPLLKDPLGQTMFDFFVLPSILANSQERPESSIGAPLYPTTATAGQKAFYFGRNLTDAMTPGVVAPVGLAAPDDKFAQLLPGYRTRQLAEGKSQKNALGIPGSESASSRTIRNVLGYMGVPVERLDTTFASKQAGQGGQ